MKPVNKMLPDVLIEDIEKKYNAKYVMDSCLMLQDGSWANWPAAFFYTEEKHPEGSNYMVFYKNQFDQGEWLITNGIRISQGEFYGFLFEDGELVHSRYRHDYFEHRGVIVDGGRDYFKSSGSSEEFVNAKRITFKIENGNIVEVENATAA